MQKQTLRNKVLYGAMVATLLVGANWIVAKPALASSRVGKTARVSAKTAKHNAALAALTQVDSSGAKPPASKSAFVQQMLTSTDAVNDQVLRERTHLLKLQAKHDQGKLLTPRDQSWLYQLADEYKVSDANLKDPQTWTALSQRVDAIPPSLVLGQSIQESGWGASSIAKRAHNYFGQTCNHSGCYPGTRYERFASMQAAVAAYVHNLNSNHAYQALRQLRFQARMENLQPNSVVMANGLNAYSELHGRYISAIKTVITRFDLQRYDNTTATA